MSSSNNNKAAPSGNAAAATGAGHRGAAARVNPDMEIYNRFGGSAAAGKEQEKRFVKYGFVVDEFNKATKKNRDIYQYGVVQKTLRDNERIKVEKEVAEAKEVIRKGEARMAAMQAADDKYKAQHGAACAQGEADALKLKKFDGYVALDHDEEPTELLRK